MCRFFVQVSSTCDKGISRPIPRPVLLIVNTGRATRPCTSGAGCHFDSALTDVTMRQKKECTMLLSPDQGLCCQYCTTNICRFHQQNTARKVHLYNYFNKKRTYRPNDESKWRRGTRFQQPNWLHGLCLLLIAQALAYTYQHCWCHAARVCLVLLWNFHQSLSTYGFCFAPLCHHQLSIDIQIRTVLGSDRRSIIPNPIHNPNPPRSEPNNFSFNSLLSFRSPI